MWRPWSKLLELLGRFRIPFGVKKHRTLRVGDPAASDARGSHGWRRFVRSDVLFDTWAPHPDSPWVPFHCVPLFAALDTLPADQIGPTRPAEASAAEHAPAPSGSAPDGIAGSPVAATADGALDGPGPREPVSGPALPGASPLPLPSHARPGAPPPHWINGETWTILDLPGPRCVEAAVWLVTSANCQPVCTFDNWPHPRGLLRPELILAELLRWASTLAHARTDLAPTSPPVWVCDADRLGTRTGGPGEFDNRYFLDDSILPGPEMLRRHAVRRAVYVAFGADQVPVLDFEEYFGELLAAGVEVVCVDLLDAELRVRPFAAPAKPRRVRRSSYRGSAAGGFGSEIPQPSSGSSG